MDSDRFDDLTRSFGKLRSRRSVVTTVGAAMLGAIGAAGFGRSASAKGSKVSICHRTGNGSFNYITVSVNAVPAHLAHGDAVTDLTDVDNCGACGNVCSAPENGTALCTENGCGYTCNDGYEPDGAGGCAAPNPCADTCITSDEPQCFWMENFSGNFCFIPYAVDTEAACIALDSCSPGGGGGSGGGCYKWSTSSC